MESQQQYIAQVKEEYDELGIWVPVNEEQEPTESVAAVVPKTEPTDQTTTTHNKPKKAKKTKRNERTKPLTKRERHVQRLETLNSLLRKDLREARDGTTVQRMKDLEAQVLLLQEAAGPNKASVIKDLKLENMQLQKKVENLQRKAKVQNDLVVRKLKKNLKREQKNRKRVEDCWRKAYERFAYLTGLEGHEAEETGELLSNEELIVQNVIKDEELMEDE